MLNNLWEPAFAKPTVEEKWKETGAIEFPSSPVRIYVHSQSSLSAEFFDSFRRLKDVESLHDSLGK